MKNTVYNIQLGLNDKDEKIQLIDSESAKTIVKKQCIDFFWWGSISLLEWIYKHEDWTVITENSVNIYLITEKPIEEFIQTLKAIFNQESILVSKAIENIEFM
jgi:hypothetical protein